jgi:hypothetical protein
MIIRTGRRRKSSVRRDPNGKSRGELEGVHPETIAVRMRELRRAGAPVRDRACALDALAGTTLGILLLRGRADPSDPGGINEPQYQAGEAWGKLRRRYVVVRGYPVGSPVSPSAEMIGGLSCADEPDEAEVLGVCRRWSDCNHALMDVCRSHGLGVRDAVQAVCIENRHVELLSAADFGNLRIGLNVLGRVLRTSDNGGSRPIGVWVQG